MHRLYHFETQSQWNWLLFWIIEIEEMCIKKCLCVKKCLYVKKCLCVWKNRKMKNCKLNWLKIKILMFKFVVIINDIFNDVEEFLLSSIIFVISKMNSLDFFFDVFVMLFNFFRLWSILKSRFYTIFSFVSISYHEFSLMNFRNKSMLMNDFFFHRRFVFFWIQTFWTNF